MTKALSFVFCNLLISSSVAFTMPRTSTTSKYLAKSTINGDQPIMLDAVEVEAVVEQDEPVSTVSTVATLEKKPVLKPKAKAMKVKKPNHQEGVFSPIVFASKKVAGEENINKLRAKFISLHSGVIGDFVATHETPIGSSIAKSLFVVMDANNDGVLDKEEVKTAFETLGFTWLKEKQVNGILKRADKDENGVIDYEEFKAEISKTLKTNLIKLAKKNGADMGLLV